MQSRNKIRPIDQMIIPVFASYETETGVRAEQSMFDKSAIVVLRFIGLEDHVEHNIFVIRPDRFDDDCFNYYSLSEKAWRY